MAKSIPTDVRIRICEGDSEEDQGGAHAIYTPKALKDILAEEDFVDDSRVREEAKKILLKLYFNEASQAFSRKEREKICQIVNNPSGYFSTEEELIERVLRLSPPHSLGHTWGRAGDREETPEFDGVYLPETPGRLSDPEADAECRAILEHSLKRIRKRIMEVFRQFGLKFLELDALKNRETPESGFSHFGWCADKGNPSDQKRYKVAVLEGEDRQVLETLPDHPFLLKEKCRPLDTRFQFHGQIIVKRLRNTLFIAPDRSGIKTLSEILNSVNKRDIILAFCRALSVYARLHDHGYVMHDIKPDNVFHTGHVFDIESINKTNEGGATPVYNPVAFQRPFASADVVFEARHGGGQATDVFTAGLSILALHINAHPLDGWKAWLGQELARNRMETESLWLKNYYRALSELGQTLGRCFACAAASSVSGIRPGEIERSEKTIEAWFHFKQSKADPLKKMRKLFGVLFSEHYSNEGHLQTLIRQMSDETVADAVSSFPDFISRLLGMLEEKKQTIRQEMGAQDARLEDNDICNELFRRFLEQQAFAGADISEEEKQLLFRALDFHPEKRPSMRELHDGMMKIYAISEEEFYAAAKEIE